MTNSHTSEAMKKPMPSPHCISPAPLPRARSGQSSATIEEPVAHSDPTATPTRKRRIANEGQLKEKALSPVVNEYASTAINIIRRRPR